MTTSKYGYNDAGEFVNLLTGNPPTAEEQIAADTAHRAMMDADQAFRTALVGRYGKRAGDMRYRTDVLPEDIRVLALAYQDACETWRGTWRKG